MGPSETEHAHDRDLRHAFARRHRDCVGDDQRDGEEDHERDPADQALDVSHHLHELSLELLLGHRLGRSVAVLEHAIDRRGNPRKVLRRTDLHVIDTGDPVRPEPFRLIQVLVLEKDVGLVARVVLTDVDQVERDGNVGPAELDMIPFLPAELLDEIRPRDEPVSRGLPLRIDRRIDRRVVEDLVEEDLRVGGELSEEIFRPVVLVDAAEPDLRRHRDDSRDLLDPLPLRERQERGEARRVLDDEAVRAAAPRGVGFHRVQQRDQYDDQDQHEDDRPGRQDRPSLLSEDVLPDQAEVLHGCLRRAADARSR